MAVEIVASVVSSLLSIFGLSAVADGWFIYVPSLNHSFIVTLSCLDWVGIILQASMYTFVMWVYVTANRYSVSNRTYLVMGFTGFVAFFFSNILRMFTEIFLLGKVYGSVYQHYLLNWQAFEEQVGLGLMLSTLFALSLISYLFLKRRLSKIPVITNIKLNY